jgi:hypothetical protein
VNLSFFFGGKTFLTRNIFLSEGEFGKGGQIAKQKFFYLVLFKARPAFRNVTSG